MNSPSLCLRNEQVQCLLDGELLPEDAADMEEHLSSCETCRAKMEAAIGDAEWWREAHESIRSPSAVNSTLHLEPGDHPEPPHADVLRLLGPTDDPAMLGRIGTYEIVGILGRGGMGVVFKGFDSALNRYVAIKMLAPHLAASGAARKRFEREAQAAAAVVHDHVMAIHGVADWQGTPYLVMPYVRGASLQKRIDDQGPLLLREILRIGMQTASGLAAAHAQGLVHRDVKPANIMMGSGVERVTLTDFGLARAVDDATLTRTGTLAGTPAYMSPEQARGQTVDFRSDLFSLGSVLYTLCTARPPFRAETSYGVLRLITDEEPRPIQQLNSDIPVWLCTLIGRLMAKEPQQRYSSAEEVATLLEACLAHVEQPALVSLPKQLIPQQAKKPTRLQTFVGLSLPRKILVIAGAIVPLLISAVLALAATNPPDIAGDWNGENWGDVVLKSIQPGQYSGTFSDTVSKEPGTLEVKWSRIERSFNGTWKEADARFGELSLNLEGDEIRGALTTDDKSTINPGTPRLATLTWKRGHQQTPAVNSNTTAATPEAASLPEDVALKDWYRADPFPEISPTAEIANGAIEAFIISDAKAHSALKLTPKQIEVIQGTLNPPLAPLRGKHLQMGDAVKAATLYRESIKPLLSHEQSNRVEELRVQHVGYKSLVKSKELATPDQKQKIQLEFQQYKLQMTALLKWQAGNAAVEITPLQEAELLKTETGQKHLLELWNDIYSILTPEQRSVFNAIRGPALTSSQSATDKSSRTIQSLSTLPPPSDAPPLLHTTSPEWFRPDSMPQDFLPNGGSMPAIRATGRRSFVEYVTSERGKNELQLATAQNQAIAQAMANASDNWFTYKIDGLLTAEQQEQARFEINQQFRVHLFERPDVMQRLGLTHSQLRAILTRTDKLRAERLALYARQREARSTPNQTPAALEKSKEDIATVENLHLKALSFIYKNILTPEQAETLNALRSSHAIRQDVWLDPFYTFRSPQAYANAPSASRQQQSPWSGVIQLKEAGTYRLTLRGKRKVFDNYKNIVFNLQEVSYGSISFHCPENETGEFGISLCTEINKETMRGFWQLVMMDNNSNYYLHLFQDHLDAIAMVDASSATKTVTSALGNNLSQLPTIQNTIQDETLWLQVEHWKLGDTSAPRSENVTTNIQNGSSDTFPADWFLADPFPEFSAVHLETYANAKIDVASALPVKNELSRLGPDQTQELKRLVNSRPDDTQGDLKHMARGNFHRFTSAQYARILELTTQRYGYRAFMQPEIAQSLDLTKVQQATVQVEILKYQSELALLDYQPNAPTPEAPLTDQVKSEKEKQLTRSGAGRELLLKLWRSIHYVLTPRQRLQFRLLRGPAFVDSATTTNPDTSAKSEATADATPQSISDWSTRISFPKAGVYQLGIGKRCVAVNISEAETYTRDCGVINIQIDEGAVRTLALKFDTIQNKDPELVGMQLHLQQDLNGKPDRLRSFEMQVLRPNTTISPDPESLQGFNGTHEQAAPLLTLKNEEWQETLTLTTKFWNLDDRNAPKDDCILFKAEGNAETPEEAATWYRPNPFPELRTPKLSEWQFSAYDLEALPAVLIHLKVNSYQAFQLIKMGDTLAKLKGRAPVNILGVLTSEQQRRCDQLRVQRYGYLAFFIPTIKDSIEISPEQLTKIENIVLNHQKEVLSQQPQNSPPQEDDIYLPTNDTIDINRDAVGTLEQEKACWQQIADILSLRGSFKTSFC